MSAGAATAEEFFQRGMAAAQRGDWPDAAANWRRALEIAPTWSAAWNNLANVQRRLGEPQAAELSLLRATLFAPEDPDYLASLARLYSDLGRGLEAERCFQRALSLRSHHLPALSGLTELLAQQGRASEALPLWERWSQADPAAAEPLNRLGMAHREAERFEAAEACWRSAMAGRPDDPAAYGNLGQLLAEQGNEAEAEQVYRVAAGRRAMPALQVLAGTVLPVILDDEAHLEASRRKLSRNLDQLWADQVRVDTATECLPTLFYLAYHGRDDRSFQERLARLAAPSRSYEPRRRSRGKRLRVGLLSHFLRDHTIGRLNIGFAERHDREQIELVAIACEPARDELTERFRRAAASFVVLPQHLPAALAALRDLELDILLYADIGMIPFTYTLASHRLAPVQVATWGHPVTSGLPTIDNFLSSTDLEPPGSETEYREKLIRLPRLSVYYDPPTPIASARRSDFGLDASAHLYVCPQTLFKFHPSFDVMLGQILRGDPQGELILLDGRHPQWRQRLQARWERVIPDVLPRIHFLPKLSRHRFLQLLQLADVMLDTPVFGGGNTSYEAFGVGLPIVTLPTPQLRGRLTAAMYAQMGLADRIPKTSEEYVRQALCLGTQPDERRRWSTCIREQSHELFADKQAVSGLQSLLLDVRS